MKELEKLYDPARVEDDIYAFWLNGGYFHTKADKNKKPYTIVMPPPNVTGQLHMGHAMDETWQDILIRYKRMQGYAALWVPGTDHASIATEAKVVAKMKEEGLTKEMLGRDGFLERAWAWKNQYGDRIVSQLKKLGCSCDWDRERFTMDEGCSKAVLKVFKYLYDKDLIYRGERIINWCPHCKTSISDAEVEYEDQEGSFWHLKYPIVGTDEFLVLATTRPETMLGDTAVAVHPDDERYKHLHGKKVLLPLLNKEIPIVTDTYVDMEFGTGVVKITPAHDPNDFEVGQRHNLPIVKVLDETAHMTADCGKYAGMDRYEARKAIVADLEAGGYLEKIEPHAHNVGTCYRCGTTIEPMVSKQWFVRMVPLAGPAIDAVRDGRIKFVPERFDKQYYHWMENTRDWCISRQLWWGHRIPAYYCDACGEVHVSDEPMTTCPKCGGALRQDEDTLDTWFSSALWPFSTLGWPDKTEDLDYFYPTNTLVTGYDIITFWVSRMIFSGLEYTGKVPFDTVLIHGLVRDAQGRKMSKSLGNGIDPLEIIDQYGADALRLTLITGNAPGNDMRFYYERVEASRNFANKVWNASRFIMMNMDGKTIPQDADRHLQPVDKWILSKLNNVVKEVTDNMENFELGIAVQKVYDFIWDEFCDWYIEMVKPRLYDTDDADSQGAALWTLKNVLLNALKLLHPFMPFVTEEIFCTLQDEEESIMISKWPEYRADWNYAAQEKDIEIIKEAVRGIRNVRSNMNVPPSKKAHVYVVSDKEDITRAFTEGKLFFASLAYASQVTVQADRTGIADDAVSVVIAGATCYIPFAELVDIAQEIERLEKEEKKLQGELARVNGMLSNEKFLSKAPESKIAEEKEKLEKYTQMMAQVKERLGALKK
mgnify:CR=1 FL=1